MLRQPQSQASAMPTRPYRHCRAPQRRAQAPSIFPGSPVRQHRRHARSTPNRAVRAALLRGSELIMHAGDVGEPEILEKLRVLAPVVAVRGNVDTGAWASGLPETAVAEGSSASIYVLHDVNMLDLHPAAA